MEVPSSWHEVSVDQFIKLGQAKEPLEQYAILLGVSVDELRETDLTSFDLAREVISNFIDTEVESPVVESFEFEEVTYIVPKNLELTSVGPYHDWLEIINKVENPNEFIPGSLAFFCRPEGEPYSKKLAAEREKIFHRLPITVAYGIAAFFLKRREEYERSISLISQTMTAPTWKQKSLISIYRVMDFTERLFIYPAETFLKWIWYGISGWVMFISSYATARMSRKPVK